MIDQHQPVGTHIIIDGVSAPAAGLNNPPWLRRVLIDAAHAVNVRVLSAQAFRFDPQGATVFLVLAESHMSIHTYPEHRVYMADIFLCGAADPAPAVTVIMRRLGGQANIRALRRGRSVDEQIMLELLPAEQRDTK